MKAAKKKKARARGWRVGTVREFLGLGAVEVSQIERELKAARAGTGTAVPTKFSANQFVLLAALHFSATKSFSSRSEWLAAATNLYRQLWPTGTNAVAGPKGAQRSLIRMGFAVSVTEGSKKSVSLTPSGARLLQRAGVVCVHEPILRTDAVGKSNRPPVDAALLIERLAAAPS